MCPLDLPRVPFSPLRSYTPVGRMTLSGNVTGIIQYHGETKNCFKTPFCQTGEHKGALKIPYLGAMFDCDGTRRPSKWLDLLYWRANQYKDWLRFHLEEIDTEGKESKFVSSQITVVDPGRVLKSYCSYGN